MIIIPAIDLKDGKVVRLEQGRFENETVYSQDPLKIARDWKSQGAELVHVVDLQGALEGRPKNSVYVKEIAEKSGLRIEVSGGLRDISAIEEAFSWGVERVVLGTAALCDEAFFDQALSRFTDRIVVSVDVKDGLVAARGWKDTTGFTPAEFIALLIKKGVSRLIYTDISRDGMLSGPNLSAFSEMFGTIDIPVIISGGVSSLDDIKKIKGLGKGNIEGVIVGKALYENKFSLRDAVNIAK